MPAQSSRAVVRPVRRESVDGWEEVAGNDRQKVPRRMKYHEHLRRKVQPRVNVESSGFVSNRRVTMINATLNQG